MTQVSKSRLSLGVEKRVTEIFLDVISKLQKKEEVSMFLDEFLTPTEKLVLSKRLAIAVMLGKGYDYESIRSVLKVTPGTISRVSYWMKYKGKIVTNIVKMIINDERSGDFWNEIAHVVGKVMVFQKGTNWGNNRRAVEQSYRDGQQPF